MSPLVLPELTSMLTLAIVRTRWRPAVPLGIPHATSKADVYDIYHIPKGATIYVNIEYVLTSSSSQKLRAIICQYLTPQSHRVLLHDPNLFDDPETFDPSRFLTPQKQAGNWNGKVESNFTLPFGFGRRVCPGMHVALKTTFISLARFVSHIPRFPPLRIVIHN